MTVFDRVGENPQKGVRLSKRNRPLTTGKLYPFHIRGISACHVKRANSDSHPTLIGKIENPLRGAMFIFIFFIIIFFPY